MGNAQFCTRSKADTDSAWKMQHALMRENKVYEFIDLNYTGELLDELRRAKDASASAASASVSSAAVGTSPDTVGTSPASAGGTAPGHTLEAAFRTSTSRFIADASDNNTTYLGQSSTRARANATLVDGSNIVVSVSTGAGTEQTMDSAVMESLKTFARKKLAKYLYKGGQATIVKPYYEEWYQEMKGKLSQNIDDKETLDQFIESEYKQDRFNRFECHTACWQLNKRGWMGETPLHLCFVMNTEEHLQVARALLEAYPNMALDVYEGKDYFGESALHIAVANGDHESVKLLVSKNANVNQRATGRFFRPNDQKDDPDGETNYEGDAYFGEYPLAFAASKGAIEIYDYLLTEGADPNKEDSFGNTVLHMAVIHNQLDMFRHAVKHKDHPAYMGIANKRNLTPLTLASMLGRSRMFQAILDMGSVENWRFGELVCSLYPLSTLDSIDPNGKTDWQSALIHIVKGDTVGHLEMLEGNVVRQLLKEKWNTFAKRMFTFRLTWAILHLLFLSAALYTRPAGHELLQHNGWRDTLRYVSEILVCGSCLAKLIETCSEIHSQRFSGFLKNCSHAPAHTIYLISCVLVLVCIPLRFFGLDVVEDVLLMFAVPGSWIFLLFFARGWKRTGPFVVMVYKMCTGDLFRFGVIYVIFFVGFTTGFFFLFRNVQSNDEGVQNYLTMGDIILNLFQMTLGEFQYAAFDSSNYPVVSKLVFFVFMILMSLLLLQMLIAMMGNTYRKIISEARKEWRRQRANMVLVLERTSFRKTSLQRYQRKYSQNLERSSLPEHRYSLLLSGTSRALMVVSKDSKDTHSDTPARTSTWTLVRQG